MKEVKQDEPDDTPSSTTATSEIIINKDQSFTSLTKPDELEYKAEISKIESSASLLANLTTQSNSPILKQKQINSSDEKFNTAVNRLKKFPNLNYVNLYNALINLIEIIPTVQLSPVGQALIHTMTCLTPFLPDDILESLPYTIALTLTTFPKDLQKCIIDSLCNNFLPIACKFYYYLNHYCESNVFEMLECLGT